MKKSIVIYHASCVDGFTAAWVARRVLGDSAEYVPAKYGDEPPDVTGKDVYILDFSYKWDTMVKMIEKASKLVCLDHHKTAEDELRILPGATIVFDMGKSGGRLAWEWFNRDWPDALVSVPWLVAYTEDRDLWRWNLPKSREINAMIGSFEFSFERWDFFCAHESMALWNTYVGEGAAIIRYQDKLIESAVSNAREITLAGHRILAVNATALQSEIGNRLAEGRPFSATWFDTGDGNRAWSLRSTDQGIDVSEIAKSYGGGGHRNAAGYRTADR